MDDKRTCIHLAVWLPIWVVTRLKLLVLVFVFLDDDNLIRLLKTLDAISQTLISITQLQSDRWNQSHGKWRNRSVSYRSELKVENHTRTLCAQNDTS